MQCQDAQILLSTRRDLNQSQRSELDAHLASCRVCAAARLEEERVSRLLASLPDPGLSAPPRVAAAIGVQAARRTITARFRKQSALAASVGTVVVLVVILLNSVAGGRLGWLFFRGSAGTETAAQPAVVATRGDVLYLIEQDGPTSAHVIAWEPERRAVRYTLPLGAPPVYRFTSDISSGPGGEMQLPPRDLVLSPTGDTLYVIEYGQGDPKLVAYATDAGTERWRTPLLEFEPFISFAALTEYAARGSLSVSPDGKHIFVRGIASWPMRPSENPDLELKMYATADGRQVGGATPLPREASVLPLSGDEVLAFDARGVATTRIPVGYEGAWEFLAEGIAAPLLLPDGKSIRAVKVDLSIIDLDVAGDGLRVTSETDLVERGGFFFDQAIFSTDGQVLTVGQTVRDPGTGADRSEVRMYAAGPWRELARHSFTGRLEGLAISKTGKTIYVVLGQAGARTSSPESNTTPDTSAPTRAAGGQGQIVALDTATGKTLDTYTVEHAAVGALAGP